MSDASAKKPPSKADLRADLNRDVDAYLKKGGEIAQVAQGETALEGRPSPLRAPLFTEPRTERTPVTHIVAELDERRKRNLKRSPTVRRTRKPRPRKRVIYDDFGEALRTVWEED